MKIYIGSDHAGFELKEKLTDYLTELGHTVLDKGASALDPSDDYPDFIRPAAEGVVSESGSFGVVIGGSGQGEAMAANKVHGARCAIFYGPVRANGAIDVTGKESDDPYILIRLARQHNDANILSLGTRFLTLQESKEAVKIFLETPFSNDPRHIRRINKLEITN